MKKTLPQAAGVTHVGLVSKENQDQYICETDLGLWIVADGMGGHAAGKMASELALKTTLDRFKSGATIEQAIVSAHGQLLHAISQDSNLKGMGTTMVAVYLQDNNYEVSWVGDSRCYQWTNRGLRQISQDHSYFQILLSDPSIDIEVARQHPEQKSLTQAIGVDHSMRLKVSSEHHQLYRGEYLLLCSDGLTDELSDKQIDKVFTAKQLPEEICSELLEAALASGGRDNITIIIMRAADDAPERAPAPQFDFNQAAVVPNRSFKRLFLTSIIIAAGLLAIGIYSFIKPS